MLRNIFVTAVALLTTSVVHAQTSYPMVMSLKPVALQVGTTAECEVHSRYTMLGTFQVFVSGEGVTAEAIAPEMPALKPGEKPKDVTKLKLKITAAADALPGVREFRLATPNGASTLGQLVIVRDPVIAEAAENNTRDKAQAVTFPATLCGVIEKEVGWAEGVEVVLGGFGAAAFAAKRAIGRRLIRVRHLRDTRVADLLLQHAVADRTPDIAGLRHDYSSDSTRRNSAL